MTGTTLVTALVSASPSSAAEIAHRMEQLRTPVRVLYVAAPSGGRSPPLRTARR
ncbi:MAG: hypothetical protein AAFU79_32735 [Myxococcota bacterium]